MGAVNRLEEDKPVPAPWPAPAKLNLFLHVLGRRADGYHDLQTAFQFVDLCDELRIEPRADGKIVRLGGAAGVSEAEDLVVRAAHRLREEAGRGLGATIEVRKRIPLQGGLGGGSSDAATTLVALNCLWGLEFGRQRLAEIGLGLGADVPVFVHGRAAWAEGVGERLEPIEPPEHHFLVVRPDCAVSTRQIFQAPELTRNSRAITIRAFFEGAGRNDCEPVVRSRHPQVAAALDWLNTRLRATAPARLTGTGSCVFVALPDVDAANDVLRALPPEWQGFAVRGMNRSPLEARVAVASPWR
jgi:4-diphosphocytidyl-2-C-methyl-D-erythritol kinase